jgi:hypothetical protein
MPVIAELYKECRLGNRAACRKLFELGWLGPITVRELKRILGSVALVPVPPRPDESSILDANFLHDVDLVRTVTGDPHPQPSIIPLKEQLRAATEFRAAMERAIKALDVEIKRLQQ